jgi:hypothetical protein
MAYSLIVFRDAALAPFAVFASQRHPNHAWHAEVLVVKLPEAQEFVDLGFLLGQTSRLWYEAGFVKHCGVVEKGAQAAQHNECEVREHVR